MVSEILNNASEKVTRFNEIGLHYNLVANQIYDKRFALDTDPLDKTFLSYIIAGLVSFDMQRLMNENPYKVDGNGFAARLNRKLQIVGSTLIPLLNIGLTDINVQSNHNIILEIYNTLSDKGTGALHIDQTKTFPVGTTKVLHFLNPKLFIIIDSYACIAFRVAHNVPFIRSTRPGYSGQRYIECMEYARNDILSYGLEQFQALEPGVPITRIYDKLLRITGNDNREK